MTAAPSRRRAGAASKALSMSAVACANALVETAIRTRRNRAIRFIRDLQLTSAQILRVESRRITRRLIRLHEHAHDAGRALGVRGLRSRRDDLGLELFPRQAR